MVVNGNIYGANTVTAGALANCWRRSANLSCVPCI